MSARGWRKGGPVPDATPQDPLEPPLPAKFIELRAFPDEKVQPGKFVNIIGLVKDWRCPVPTCRDWKSSVELYDFSTADQPYGIKLNIFRPEGEHPDVGLGDVLLLTNVKVQRHLAHEPLSMITNYSTSICVYSASKIPKPPQSAQNALAPAPKKGDRYVPSAEESRYVSYLYHKIDKNGLPEEHEFKQRTEQSLKVKDKFRLLKDIEEAKFCNLIAQVVTEPYARFDYDTVVTFNVSDYTENANFYNAQYQPSSELGGDPYGYTSDDRGKKWPGPYGKMSLLITCYEPHATAVREDVKVGDWVELRNVQIKYGRDGKYLEGVMRENRNLDASRVDVSVLEATDPETIDPRLKEAIRRCRDYNKKKKQQLKDIKSAQAAGLKRKASHSHSQSNSPQPEKRQLNAKERRKLLRREPREAQERQVQKKSVQENPVDNSACFELNDQVTCEKHAVPFSTVASILKPCIVQRTVDGESITLPFTCAKYIARVRVVDFWPPSLEDFACSRKHTEFDVLSDDGDSPSPSSSPSSSSSSDDDDEDSSGSNRVWEWLFALQLEDPGPPSSGPRPRLWAYVDNIEAQCLTGLNATDLRKDPETLDQLREVMSVLWGKLEEHKARKMGKGKTAEMSEKRPARRGRKPQLPERPPLDSDGEGEAANEEEPPSNKPFSCCLKQYGIQVPDKDAKDGRKWERCFGLFGTKICS